MFIRELNNLIDHLGLRESGFDIFDQSWGGMFGRFGSSYAASRPAGLRRLVLSNIPTSVELWMKSIRRLRAELPKEVQDAIDEAERTGRTESTGYQ